jgi:mannose-1-phosphate guanylyltransferase
MTKSNLVVVIMAGGAGTRFWPLSTPECPKQFVNLLGEQSLLQVTYQRVLKLAVPERILVLTGAGFVDLVHSQLPGLPRENVVGEPVGRDTGAAVTLAAHLCRSRFEDPVMVVVPADHVIEPLEEFARTVKSAVEGAEATGGLYTFGIEPTYPATGYGYLELGETLGTREGVTHYRLHRFKEKPDREMAEGFLASGKFLWNAGIFVWQTSTIWQALERHLPIHTARIGAVEMHQEPNPEKLREALDPLEKVSIDFAVMEKEKGVCTIRAQFDWNDVGGWLALEKDLSESPGGNRTRGEIHLQEARENLVFCEDPQEVVGLVGVHNLVVVRAGERTLVAHRDRLEELKILVKESLYPGS